jgi:hypothetical protein
MRKLLFILSFLPIITFGQVTNINSPAIQTDYLQKARGQKTAAWILLGGGAVITSVGFAVASSGVIVEIVTGHSKNYNTGMVLVAGGLICMAGSIPLFIASSKNKRKGRLAASSYFKMEKIPVIQNRALVALSYPAVSLKINL